MRKHPLLLSLLAFPCLGVSLQAGVVHLVDGGSLVGILAHDRASGSVTLDTVDGARQISRDRILKIEDDRRLRATLGRMEAGLPADNDSATFRLASWALSKGLFADALRLFDASLVAATARGVAGGELPGGLFDLPLLGIHRNDELSANGAARLLGAAGREERAPATARLALERLALLSARHDVGSALRRGLNSDSPGERLAVVRVLTRSPATEFTSKLIGVALADPDRRLRVAAAAALKEYGQQGTIASLVRVLDQRDPALRAAALDTLETLGDSRAVGALVRHLRRMPRPSPRSTVSGVEQRAFVAGFDVDVANSAFIANPDIGVLQSGHVLTARVHDLVRAPSAAERDRTAAVLRVLTGHDAGADAAAWESWLREQAHESGNRFP